jgi:hypothetical protein
MSDIVVNTNVPVGNAQILLYSIITITSFTKVGDGMPSQCATNLAAPNKSDSIVVTLTAAGSMTGVNYLALWTDAFTANNSVRSARVFGFDSVAVKPTLVFAEVHTTDGATCDVVTDHVDYGQFFGYQDLFKRRLPTITRAGYVPPTAPEYNLFGLFLKFGTGCDMNGSLSGVELCY